jgi:hypothetical protein
MPACCVGYVLMSHGYFPVPPTTLSPEQQLGWLARVREAERLVGLLEGRVPVASDDTMALLARYVKGEMSLEEVVAVQTRRLGPRRS